jgi:hypothetical protein
MSSCRAITGYYIDPNVTSNITAKVKGIKTPFIENGIKI